jgi:hypothetical protein
MALNDTSKINISLKRLSGKAHTSNDKGLANEALPSNISMASSTIFSKQPPASPTSTNLYDITSVESKQWVELVRFELEFITGTDTNAGEHSFALKLPTAGTSYTAGSSNSKKGTGNFTNGKKIYDTTGKLQLVPPSFGDAYTAKAYYGGDHTKGDGDPIGPADARNWALDYFNGIFYQQDPPSSPSQKPTHVEAFLYIGDFLDTDGAGGGTGGIERYYYSHTGVSATTISPTGMDFTGITPTNADTKLYLNGQLLLGGTVANVNANTVDYAFTNNTDVFFGFDIEADDSISIFHTTTSFSTGKPFLLYSDDASFNNRKVITAGDGITINQATGQDFIINNSGLIQRTKEHFTNLSHISKVFTFTFGGSTNFSYNNHSDDRIDIYVNGVLKEKGYDYNFTDDGSGGFEDNKITWLSNTTPPSNSDRFTIIIF